MRDAEQILDDRHADPCGEQTAEREDAQHKPFRFGFGAVLHIKEDQPDQGWHEREEDPGQ